MIVFLRRMCVCSKRKRLILLRMCAVSGRDLIGNRRCNMASGGKDRSPNSGGGGCMVGQLYGAVVTAVDRAEAIIRPH